LKLSPVKTAKMVKMDSMVDQAEMDKMVKMVLQVNLVLRALLVLLGLRDPVVAAALQHLLPQHQRAQAWVRELFELEPVMMQ
jgi:hypothetical protein